MKVYTVKPVLSGHSEIDKTKILMTNGSLMKVKSTCIKVYTVKPVMSWSSKSIAECSPWAFCNTFDLHLAIIGLETNFGLLFEWPLKTGFTVIIPYGPRREKTCLQRLAKNKSADQHAYPSSLISAFVIHLLECIISRLATSGNFNFLACLCSWAGWFASDCRKPWRQVFSWRGPYYPWQVRFRLEQKSIDFSFHCTFFSSMISNLFGSTIYCNFMIYL